jgi:diguanylate cyclase (GGDEF)-like protein
MLLVYLNRGNMFLLQLSSLIFGFLIVLLLIISRTRRRYFQLRDNVRLLRETNRKLQIDVEDIFGIYEGVKVVTMKLKMEEILETMSHMVYKFFEFSRAQLFLFGEEVSGGDREVIFDSPDGGGKTFINLQYDFSTKLSLKEKTEIADEEIKKVIIRRKEVVFPSDKKLHHYVDDDRIQTIYMIVPLITEDRVVGVIRMEREGEPFLPFSEDDVNKLSILCAQTAVVLRRAHLFGEVERLAIFDGLTGLYVHRYFQESLAQELKRASAFKEMFSLLMIDIDHFKKYNDEYGHLAGDEILRRIAKVLKDGVHETDFVARYGGEEFAIILLHKGKEEAKKLAGELRESVEAMIVKIDGKDTKITISAGLATFPDDADSPNEIIKCADHVLYEAKTGGRNRVVAYSKAVEK